MSEARTKILIIAANPWNTDRLGLDEEYREVENIRLKSKNRELFKLKYVPAVRESELRQALLDFEPNIIHFSGHGELDGLFFMDDSGNRYQIGKQALANLFGLFSSQIRCVVLNACYSEHQAYSIAENIDYVVGMNKSIGDIAAIKFSIGFYQALFSGRDITFAYEFARNTIDLSNIPEKDTPVLITKESSTKKPIENYLSNYEYDVLVHIADSEKIWAETLVQQLQKHLTQRFPQGLNLRLQTESNVLFEHAATNLLLLSSACVANYSTVLNSLTPTIKQQHLFLADYQPVERPQALNGLLSYNFWKVDPTQGLRCLTPADHDYSLQVENLAQDIEKRLKTLFQHQQLKAIYQQTTSSFTNSGNSVNNSVVFVNVATEDRLLAEQVQQSLDKKGIVSSLPLDQSFKPSPQEIREDIKMSLTECDAVLIIYGNSSPLWLKEQLLMCHRWQRKRVDEDPLKVIALHYEINGKSDSKLPVNLPDLQVFYCPPKSIDEYLEGFMEALK